jgi:peroxiredoxin
MNVFLLLARVLLAAVFAISAAAKLRDAAGSRKAVGDFGLPPLLAGPVAFLLPFVELGIAVALVPVASAWYGAVGALALMAVFTAAIIVNLLLGRRPDCHCFGELTNGAIGWPSVARNVAIGAVATSIAVQGIGSSGASAVNWLDGLNLAEGVALSNGLIALVIAGVALWLLSGLVAQNGRLLLRLDGLEAALTNQPVSAPAGSVATLPPAGLPAGTKAPDFRLPDLHGQTITLEGLAAAAKPLVLLFTDPGCGPCTGLMPEVSRWQRELASKMTVALVSRGNVADNRAKTAEFGLANLLLQNDREVAEAYQSQGTPSAVLIAADGTIASPLALGSDAIRMLVSQVSNGSTQAQHPIPMVATDGRCPNCGQYHSNGNGANGNGAAAIGPAIGQPAPALRLPDLAGTTVDLADRRGESTLVLFWNPSCGFCQKMLPDITAWEEARPSGAPELLVVSTGSVTDNEALGFRATVLLDQNFSIGPSFGVQGTPSAVLVDAEGRIASSVAVGAEAALALARPASQTAA